MNVTRTTKADVLSVLDSSMSSFFASISFDEFERIVQEQLEIIPPQYLEGLQGVHCFESVKRDPQETQLVRLGEYLDPGPDQFLDSRVHIGRHVSLYYGSFLAIAHEGFDWEEQIWETLTHEIQHHVESKAGDRTLIEWDMDQMRRFKAQKSAKPNWREFA
jgi:predicted Zn-dependent protease with MMP-like domain